MILALKAYLLICAIASALVVIGGRNLARARDAREARRLAPQPGEATR